MVRWLLVVLLASMALGETVMRASRVPATDLYELWAAAAAQRLSGHTLGSPYRDHQGYWAVLSAHAETSTDPRLKAAHRLWASYAPVASPFLLLLFSLLPAQFGAATVLFVSLQALAFLVSVMGLGWLFRQDRFLVLCIALVLLRVYEPLLSDMRVGNVATLQLLALVGLAMLAIRLVAPDPPHRAATLAAVLGAGLALLVVAKLNMLLVVALLALPLLLARDRRPALVTSVAAATATAVCVVFPCAYFRGCAIWLDWYSQVIGPGIEITGRTVAQGNYATTRILADLLGMPVSVPALAVAAALAVSLSLATRRARGPGTRWSAVLGAVARDPAAMVSIGITATTALAPLMWLHYYVWSLLPAFWLMRANRDDRAVATLGAVSVALSAGALNIVAALSGLSWLVPSVMAASWLPLWVGILLEVGRERDERLDAPRSARPGAAGARLRGPSWTRTSKRVTLRP